MIRTYLDPQLARRIGDIAWIASRPVDASQLVIMIEAQSTIDPAMAPRMSILVAMYLEEQLRRRPHLPLPQVLPIVYYTGASRWNAATALYETESAGQNALPFMRGPCYLVLDAGQLVAKDLVDKCSYKSDVDKSNVASLMMRMEAARDDQALLELLADSADWLGKTERTLWLDLLSWAAEVLVPRRYPSLQLYQLRNYVEGIDMLAERMRELRKRQIVEWRDRGMAEGLAQGRAQGLEQGLEQGIEKGIEQGREQGLERGLAEGERRGQRVLLQSLAVRRFGDHTAERLNVFLDEAPHSERAVQAGNWLIDCQTEAEFLQRLEAAA